MKALVVLVIFQIVYYEIMEQGEAGKADLAPVRLKNDLMRDYEKTIRPKINAQNETKVTMKMILKSFSFEQHSEKIDINSWLAVTWTDDHLVWKKEDYDNIGRLHISSDEIWVPDISIYNRKDQDGSPQVINSVDCQIFSRGVVVAVVPSSESGICIPKLRKYPFDTQTCTIRFGSWVHSGEELNLQPNSVPFSKEDLTENPEFELLNVTVTRNSGKYKCCPNNTYPSLNYIFTVKRHSAAVAAIYVIPAIVLVILTLTTLWINIESTDRLCVCCCNLIVHFLFIESLWWNIPSGGLETPLLIIYSRDSLLLTGFSLILTIIIRTMQGSKEQTPSWVSSTTSLIYGSRVGKVLFLFDTSLKSYASAKGEEDAVKIVENVESVEAENKDWILFAKIIDKLCFLAFFITYVFMFVGFLP